MKRLSIIIFCLLFAVPIGAAKKDVPHVKEAADVGVIEGKLTDGKKPLGDYTVTLEVRQSDILILTLPKKTDKNGEYKFKNIFQSPMFSYAISTIYNGKTYRTEFISLGKNEKSHTLILDISITEPLSPPRPPLKTAKSRGQMNEYQILSIILALGAVGFAIYQKRKAG